MLLRLRPFERPPDTTDSPIDLVPTEVLNIDHVLTDDLERLGTEVAGSRMAIEFVHGTQGIADSVGLLFFSPYETLACR